MEDSQFIQDINKGKASAFRQLVTQYQNMVLNTCFGLLHVREDAEDVAQEVFIEVYGSIANFRQDSKLSTWLYRIAVNRSMDFIRRKNRKKRFGTVLGFFGPDQTDMGKAAESHTPEQAMEHEDRKRVLQQAIDKLPEKQRIAFVLNKYEELSYTEIAEVMKTTVPSVEALLHRAKTKLKSLLYVYYEQVEKSGAK